MEIKTHKSLPYTHWVGLSNTRFKVLVNAVQIFFCCYLVHALVPAFHVMEQEEGQPLWGLHLHQLFLFFPFSQPTIKFFYRQGPTFCMLGSKSNVKRLFAPFKSGASKSPDYKWLQYFFAGLAQLTSIYFRQFFGVPQQQHLMGFGLSLNDCFINANPSIF